MTETHVRLTCRAENPYGTGVCTLPLGHPPFTEAGARGLASDLADTFDHYDGGIKVAWVGSIQATESRAGVLYSGWRQAFHPQPNDELRALLKMIVGKLEICPRCYALVLTDNRLAHQATEENER